MFYFGLRGPLRRREAEALADRRRWLEEVALPALRHTQLLSGCPEAFLTHLAWQLHEACRPWEFEMEPGVL